MSVMDTVSEPAQTEREKYIRSVGVRERTRCRQRVRFVCFSERETDSILEQRGEKKKTKGSVSLLITQQHKSPSSQHFSNSLSVKITTLTGAVLHQPTFTCPFILNPWPTPKYVHTLRQVCVQSAKTDYIKT